MDIKELFNNITFENSDFFCFIDTGALKKDETIKSLTALANSNGGYFFFGVRDDGTVAGLGLECLTVLRQAMESINFAFNAPVSYGISMRSIDAYAENYVFCVAIQKSETKILLKANESSGLYYYFESGTVLCGTDKFLTKGIDHYFRKDRWLSFVSNCSNLPNNENALVDFLQKEELIDEKNEPYAGFDLFGDFYDGPLSRIVFRRARSSYGENENRSFEGPFLSSVSSCLSYLSAYFEKTQASYSLDLIKLAILLCFQLRDYEDECPVIIEVGARELSVFCSSKAYCLVDSTKTKTAIFNKTNKCVLKCFSFLYGQTFKISELIDRPGDPYFLKAANGKISFVFANSSQTNSALWPGESEKTLAKHEGEKQRVLKSLENGPMGVSKLQCLSSFGSRAYFLKKVINPLVDDGRIEKIGDKHSPVCVYRLKKS